MKEYMSRDKIGWILVFVLIALAAGVTWLERGRPARADSRRPARQSEMRPYLAGWSMAPTRRTAAVRYLEHSWSSGGTRVTGCEAGPAEHKPEWVKDHWVSCEDVNVSCQLTYPSGDQKTIETTVCVQKSDGDWVAAFSRPY